MAEDGEVPTKHFKKTQDTFQRAQEVPTEHRFPARAGIVNIPRGSRGPRSLYVSRKDDSFGFTLRHFIVYPPDSAESDVRYLPVAVQLQPMETIFVKHIVEGGPAEQAGLRRGDRLVAVNGVSVTDKSYSQVIQLIQRSPEYLHLLVIAKEEDILQKYYTDFAYNPASNQISKDYQEDRPVHTTKPKRSSDIQADAISWRSLQNSSLHAHDGSKLKLKNPRQEQRSADNILSTPREPLRNQKSFEIYTQPVLHEPYQRPRAQPQVPLHRKMGRRASEGSTFAERDIYDSVTGGPFEMVVGDNTKTAKSQYMADTAPQASHPSLEMPGLNFPNSTGCRLSLDAGRRDSTSSLTSSLADGSKDSLNSYDSSSTLTGRDLDNPAMSRIIRSLQQKEEFLKANNPPDSLIQKEFYGRPKRLEKQVWPPLEPRQESPSRTNKPTHQNFQRVKNDIDNERDYSHNNESKQMEQFGLPQHKITISPKDWPRLSQINNYKMHEASPPPANLQQPQQINGSASQIDIDDTRNYPPNLKIVSKRARQFETGRPMPEDDPLLNDRMSFHRSELARLTSKRVVPNVTIRAREFESLTSEPRRDTNTSSTNSSAGLRKSHRDSRSLDSSGSNGSINSLCENANAKLSGNVTVPIGSKYIHVPPPKEYQGNQDVSNIDNLPNRMRIRSNSADSWVTTTKGGKYQEIESLGNGIDVTTKEDRSLQEAMDTTLVSQNIGDRSPLIPLSLELMQLAPSVSITPAPNPVYKSPVRPTLLDLSAPKRPARHLRPPSESADTPPPRPISPAIEDRPVVVRRTKNTNIADEERAMRRESYLKATEGGRMHFDSDLSDGDVSPQVLRSSSVSGGSSSSVSLEREKRPSSPSEKEKQNIVKEGHLHCKITEIDGKRSADRSWKQIWVVLKGPKLFLYKDRHHQSPVGTSEAADQSLASGIDMRASCVRVAEDYTKRKHVLRVSSALPCRSELLLQADNTMELVEWVKALQDQVSSNTDVEAKMEQVGVSKQQAVPQTIPASTSIQVQGSSRLSPQPNKSKLPNLRNRSPTGQSPVSKTRKPSQVNDAATSPKSKTWRGRVVKQFRKIQGASSPSSPTAPEGSTFGVQLEHCLPSNYNQYVPRLVEVCTEIVENKGLEMIGIYRVPGNNAAVTALTDEANRCFEELTLIDPRWNDVHVVSSLLKSFFRKMPDSLLTTTLYPCFIEADKIDNPTVRMGEIKKLIKSLPPHHYNTLRHLILHLRKVVEHREANKMEARNLAIVFGPTIVRASEENMETMVNDMTHQCKIVESLLTYADWFFTDDDLEELKLSAPIATVESISNEEDQTNRALLLDNISKVEGFKEQKEKKELLHSLFSAAQRKVKKIGTKGVSSSQDSKEEVISPNGMKEFSNQNFDVTDLKEDTPDFKPIDVPTTVTDLDKSSKPYYNYKNGKEMMERRVRNFIEETEASMSIPRKPQIIHLGRKSGPTPISSSASNVNQNMPLSLATNANDNRVITKTHSASNVFSRTTNSDNGRNSLSSSDSYTVQYPSNRNHKYSDFRNVDRNYDKRNRQFENINYFQAYKSSFSDISATSSDQRSNKSSGYNLGNSVENINSSSMDLNANANMKKIKYENEGHLGQRAGSLDSLNKFDDDSDLVKTITKIFDEKKKEYSPLLAEIDLPFADDSPEKLARDHSHLNKENIPASPKLYRNPSLHKNQYRISKLSTLQNKEFKDKVEKEKEKDEDSTMAHEEIIPDNERHISSEDKLTLNSGNAKNLNVNLALAPSNAKLKRSESLNKPDCSTVSPLNIKLKRSESLNKASDKLKRSDSLTKTEKTESNINKRRELSSSSRRTNKEFTKLKRKNGMPERSIKRRHTVGGTKDPDKVTWLDNRFHEDSTSIKENTKEKTSLRTSSPDLSSTRRELFLKVNLIGPEDMVAALRQHLIGARPQSFPETTVYKVPLESHV